MSSESRDRASLVLNVVLAVTAAVLALTGSRPARAPKTSAVTIADETPVPIRQAHSPQYPNTASAPDQRRWLVDQLRAMGVPNKVLARIVWADLDWKWNQRGGELSLKTHGDPDTMARFKLENEMSLDAEMRAALGEEGFKQWDRENMLREANAGKIDFSPSETEAAYDSWKKVQQLDLELRRARLEGQMDDADANEVLGKAISEFRQQMKSLLGDERYAKSQQEDDGTTAASLRQDFAKANPSDSQFQELLKTQQQWNERRAELDKQFQDDQSSGAYADQLKALDKARDEEYQRVLGTNVFDALQKAEDPGYLRMKKYADLWGLDDNKIESVYATMRYYDKAVQDYQTRARALEAAGQSVDWDGVNKNLQEFANQTGVALQNYLGLDSFNKLQRNGLFELSPPELTAHGRPSQ